MNRVRKLSLTDALFALDAEIHPFLEINRARSILKGIVATARPILYYSRTTRSSASLMNRLVFRDLAIRCVSGGYENDSSLTSVMLHRYASCLGAVVASLALAEPLHIPVRAVQYNRHFGVRFRGEGRTLDIEPPCGQHADPLVQTDRGIPLTTEQFLAVLRERRHLPGQTPVRTDSTRVPRPPASRPR